MNTALGLTWWHYASPDYPHFILQVFQHQDGGDGDWASSNAELAHLLNAFSEFHACHTYGPDKGVFQPYILELLTAQMGAVVDWYMPTAEELEAAAEFRATGIQRIY